MQQKNNSILNAQKSCSFSDAEFIHSSQESEAYMLINPDNYKANAFWSGSKLQQESYTRWSACKCRHRIAAL